jgi:hypothetical protein
MGYEAEMHCNGELVAAVEAPTMPEAMAEMGRYLMQYQADGPIEVYRVERTLVASFPQWPRENPNSQEAP